MKQLFESCVWRAIVVAVFSYYHHSLGFPISNFFLLQLHHLSVRPHWDEKC